MGDCNECKHRHPLKRNCLLGRVPENCASPQGRRGDAQLFDRILSLSPEELTEQRRQEKARRETEQRSKGKLGISRNSDWV